MKKKVNGLLNFGGFKEKICLVVGGELGKKGKK